MHELGDGGRGGDGGDGGNAGSGGQVDFHANDPRLLALVEADVRKGLGGRRGSGGSGGSTCADVSTLTNRFIASLTFRFDRTGGGSGGSGGSGGPRTQRRVTKRDHNGNTRTVTEYGRSTSSGSRGYSGSSGPYVVSTLVRHRHQHIRPRTHSHDRRALRTETEQTDGTDRTDRTV